MPAISIGTKKSDHAKSQTHTSRIISPLLFDDVVEINTFTPKLMSRGIDYSKWDHIDEDDSSDDEQQKVSTQTAATSASKCPMPPTSFQSSEPNLMLPQNVEVSKQTKEGSEKGRYRFEYGGRLIYEWEQNLDGQLSF